MDQYSCSALEEKRSETAGSSEFICIRRAQCLGTLFLLLSSDLLSWWCPNTWTVRSTNGPVTFAEKSAFSNVLTVSHKFRYCGHRFHLNDLACHTVLPLLLTSSHHNALLTPSGSGSVDGDEIGGVALQPTRPMRGIPRKQLRNAATRTVPWPQCDLQWADPLESRSYWPTLLHRGRVGASTNQLAAHICVLQRGLAANTHP